LVTFIVFFAHATGCNKISLHIATDDYNIRNNNNNNDNNNIAVQLNYLRFKQQTKGQLQSKHKYRRERKQTKYETKAIYIILILVINHLVNTNCIDRATATCRRS
jgi:hypothetical protein